MLSHGNIASNVSGIALDLHVRAGRSLALVLAVGARVRADVRGAHACSAWVARSRSTTRSSNLLANLAEVKPTILVAVPRIFNRIYDEREPADRGETARAPAHPPRGAPRRRQARARRARRARRATRARARRASSSSRRCARSSAAGSSTRSAASATLGREVAEFIDALGIAVYEGYGLTETSPIVAGNCPGHRKLGSVGRVLPNVRVVIDESAATARGEGEIVVYGPNVMKGYHAATGGEREGVHRRTAACAPATSATSTRTATCSSPAGSRSSTSSRTAST